jgi:hypothetical protein
LSNALYARFDYDGAAPQAQHFFNSKPYIIASGLVELVSGGPLNAVMSQGASDADLGLFGGRQRPNLVSDPNTTGSDSDRAASNGQATARWFNANAYANPGLGVYGNAPRTK